MSPPRFTLEPAASPTPAAERDAKIKDPGFGTLMTDHMVQIRYDEDRGWHDPVLCAHQPLHLAPAASFIHYGQAVFEGLKAFGQPDGSVATFRAADHARRFQRSAQRLAMAQLPVDLFLESIQHLVAADRDWVPRGDGQALYLRPTLVATDEALGVRPSRSYLYFLIASPVNRYFKTGVSPVDVWLTRDYVRAAPGGTGAAKAAGNYAASLVAQEQAHQHGCEQVIWLDGREHKYIEELGGMNLFFGFRDGDKTKLVTPSLGDTVLAGITRDSIIRLATDAGIEVEERAVPFSECIEGIGTGRLCEAFACGTAAVIAPLGTIRAADGEWTIHSGEGGPLAAQLRQRLVGIQYGTLADPYAWRQPIP